MPSSDAIRSGDPQGTPSAASPPGRKPRSRTLLIALPTLVAVAAATFLLAESVFPVRIPPLLQGKWKVMKVDLPPELKIRHGDVPPDSTVEFHRDGTMILSNDKGSLTAKAHVEGNRLLIATNDVQTDSQEILELNDRLFVAQDARGELLIMQRVVPEKRGGPGGKP